MEESDYLQISQQVGSIPPFVATNLQRMLERHLGNGGLYYRIFSRCKSGQSTANKIKQKGYSKNAKQMQDLIGIRVALYFQDDVDICVSLTEEVFGKAVEIVHDPVEEDAFHPVRLNIIYRMPEETIHDIDPTIWRYPIDQTFEIQLRTVFSEGWHEIEHDLRYKSKQDWEGYVELSRNLNGIFAVLETCDWSILKILDQLSYEKYKKQDWAAMLRIHFRIRVDSVVLDPEIESLLNEDQELAKKVFRAERAELIRFLSSPKTIPIPKNLNNIVYIVNALVIKNDLLLEKTPDLLKKQVEAYWGTGGPARC